MFRRIEEFLDRTTMYRLLLYYLGTLLAAAAALSAIGILPYDPLYIFASTAFLAAVCWIFNEGVARVWRVPTNAESSLITAFILGFLITPEAPYASFFFLFWAAILGMLSKYLITIRGKHFFNPAAFAVATTALVLGQSASWWAGGNLPLLPFVLLGGLLVVRKLRRFDLILAFLAAAAMATLAPIIADGGDILGSLDGMVAHTPLLFFAFVMITEPLTTPPRRMGRILYGAFVGFLFAPWVHVSSFYLTPETALLAGNIFSYAISPKYQAMLRLAQVRTIAKDTYEFIFAGRPPAFKPGQYAEFTLAADSSDSRGNRRYFTLASSPTERDVRLGVKFYADPSTFKQYLANFEAGTGILAGSIAGDFTLPRDKQQKLVFLAGGIGITPFRSMTKYLTDRGEKRDIVLLYSNKTQDEIAYKEIFDAAQAAGIGLRAVYTLTSPEVPVSWQGSRGTIDAAMIAREVPDYRERAFYVSGPRSMVTAFEGTLRGMGIPRRRIKTDFFPGFA